MDLYEYQNHATEAVVKALRERGMALVDMATGLGKTVVAAHATRILKSKRTLVLCHDGDILEQSERTFENITGWRGEFFRSGKKPIRRIVFATLQLMRERKEDFAPDEFGLVIVDEAHHSMADTYEDVIRYFSGMKLGLTATPERMDGRSIEDIFGPAVVSITLEQAVRRGLLNAFEYRLMSDSLNEQTLREIAGKPASERISMEDVNKRLFIEMRDEEIVARVRAIVGDRKTVIFCRNVRHAERIAGLFEGEAEAYHSGLTKAVARDILPRFREGAFQFLVVVNKANEGVDVPDAEAVIFLRNTESRTIFLQQLGRSLRKLLGKRTTLVLDFVGSIERMLMLRDFVRRISESDVEWDSEQRPRKQPLVVSGEGFQFAFDETIVDALELLADLEARRKDFYPTWQEAAEAAVKLGIKTQKEYTNRYREDARLPAVPARVYGVRWADFLGKPWRRKTLNDLRGLYATVQEAQTATKNLGIPNRRAYEQHWRENPRLPSNPAHAYGVSWRDFFGSRKRLTREGGGLYLSWEEASEAASRLGMHSISEYQRGRHADPRLPANPCLVYGIKWSAILKKADPRYDRPRYRKWEEASQAAQKLGISGAQEYLRRYKEDDKLVSNPAQYYPTFPGWVKFLSRGKAGA